MKLNYNIDAALELTLDVTLNKRVIRVLEPTVKLTKRLIETQELLENQDLTALEKIDYKVDLLIDMLNNNKDKIKITKRDIEKLSITIIDHLLMQISVMRAIANKNPN